MPNLQLSTGESDGYGGQLSEQMFNQDNFYVNSVVRNQEAGLVQARDCFGHSSRSYAATLDGLGQLAQQQTSL